LLGTATRQSQTRSKLPGFAASARSALLPAGLGLGAGAVPAAELGDASQGQESKAEHPSRR